MVVRELKLTLELTPGLAYIHPYTNLHATNRSPDPHPNLSLILVVNITLTVILTLLRNLTVAVTLTVVPNSIEC